MTISELIQQLEKYPDETPILLSQDSEGNGFGLLYDVGEGMYDPKLTHWIEEMYPTDEEIDNSDGYYTEEDRAPEGSQFAVVLWPM